MMKVIRACRLLTGICCLLLVLLLVSCSGKSPAVAYYGLALIEQSDPGAETVAQRDIALGVGPVSVPEYLKRAQIATRLDGGHYRFDEFHRWAGMIEKEIASVIGNNLGLLIGTDKIMFFPWLQHFKPDYRIIVDIIQFDSNLEGDAVLSARWSINDASGEKIMTSGKSDYRYALDNPSYEALIDAESLILAKFSRELAVELKALALSE